MKLVLLILPFLAVAPIFTGENNQPNQAKLLEAARGNATNFASAEKQFNKAKSCFKEICIARDCFQIPVTFFGSPQYSTIKNLVDTMNTQNHEYKNNIDALKKINPALTHPNENYKVFDQKQAEAHQWISFHKMQLIELVTNPALESSIKTQLFIAGAKRIGIAGGILGLSHILIEKFFSKDHNTYHRAIGNFVGGAGILTFSCIAAMPFLFAGAKFIKTAVLLPRTIRKNFTNS